MINSFRVDALAPSDPDVKYDIVVAALGYESRSTHAAAAKYRHAATRIAWAFERQHCLNYDANRTWFETRAYEMVSGELRLDERIAEIGQHESNVRIGIDVSCLTRRRIAEIVWQMLNIPLVVPVTCDFLYSVAAYSDQGQPRSEPVVYAGPVTREFAGWSTDLRLPVSLVIGLGYEPDRAVGAVQYIEPDAIYAWMPVGTDKRYEEAIERVNGEFMQLLPRGRWTQYAVYDPHALLWALESQVGALAKASRPVLLPLGPKIYALATLLCAARCRQASVWRVTSGELGEAIDRVAAGPIVGLRVQQEPTTSSRRDALDACAT